MAIRGEHTWVCSGNMRVHMQNDNTRLLVWCMHGHENVYIGLHVSCDVKALGLQMSYKVHATRSLTLYL